jgi:hypothetical protein
MDASNRRDVSKRDLYVGNGHRWMVKEGFDDEPGGEEPQVSERCYHIR